MTINKVIFYLIITCGLFAIYCSVNIGMSWDEFLQHFALFHSPQIFHTESIYALKIMYNRTKSVCNYTISLQTAIHLSFYVMFPILYIPILHRYIVLAQIPTDLVWAYQIYINTNTKYNECNGILDSRRLSIKRP